MSLISLLPILLLAGAPAKAERPAAGDSIEVEHRGSKMVSLGRPVSRVSVGSSELVDVAAFAPDQLLITGKRLGSTALTVWSGNDVLSFQLVVTHPTRNILAILQRALPRARELRLDSAGGNLILSGEVSTPSDVERATQIVAGFFGQVGGGNGLEPPKLVNLLRVPGEQQVQLEVMFAEVSRSALRQLGVNMFASNKNGAVGLNAPTGGINTPSTGGPPVVGLPLSNTFGVLLTLGANSQLPITAALSVLSNNGYSRTLAEPTLVALSGEEARFLAGGEFPVAVPTTLGQIQIEWKKFGIQLGFVPTIVDDTIQLKVATTVSDVDFSLGIKMASVTVPGLSSRHSETVVRLEDGQNFAIAGLLSDKVRSSVDRIPGLGDLPVLGTLFRSTSYRRDETELLVVVTARRVRPQSKRPMLPGEWTRADPNDLQLFLLGTHESRRTGRRPQRLVPQESITEPAGPVGFDRELPQTAPPPAAAPPRADEARP